MPEPENVDTMAGTPDTDTVAGERNRSGVVIRPLTGWSSLDLGELWRYRELLYFLTWRDVKVRYKQAVLGVAWAVLQPLLTMVVFTRRLRQAARRRVRDRRACRTRCSATRRCCPGSSSPERSRACGQQPGGQREPADQGLLPAARDPRLGGARRARRLRHRASSCCSCLMAGLRRRPDLGHGVAALLRAAGRASRRSRVGSGSRRSTCTTATCSTSSRSWCRSGCS